MGVLESKRVHTSMCIHIFSNNTLLHDRIICVIIIAGINSQTFVRVNTSHLKVSANRIPNLGIAGHVSPAPRESVDEALHRSGYTIQPLTASVHCTPMEDK